MRQFLIGVLLAVAIITGSTVSAEEDKKGWEPCGYLSLFYQTRYQSTRLGTVPYDAPNLFGIANLCLPFGFFTEVGARVGFDDNQWSSNKGDELVPAFGWKGKVGDYDVKGVVTYFNYTPIGHWDNGDCITEALFVSRTFKLSDDHALIPEFRTEWIHRPGLVGDGCITLMPSLTHLWSKPFGIDCLTVSNCIGMQWNSDYSPVVHDGSTAKYDLGFRWKLSSHMSLVFPGYLMVTPISTDDARETHHTFYTGIVWQY